MHRAEAHQHIFKLLFFRSNLHKCTEQKVTSASRSLLLSAKQLAQVHRAEAQEPAIGGLAYRKQLAQVHRAEVRLSSCRLPPVQKQLAQVHRAEA